MNEIIACKGTGEDKTRCEYNSVWLCKNPACKSPILTATLLGARPSGCPKIDKLNCKGSAGRITIKD